MAFNFPSSPTVDQTYTSGSTTYKYNGNAWIVVGAAAAPYDALAYNGMQVNGGMEVSQEFGVDVSRPTPGYTGDGWNNAFVGTMGFVAGVTSEGLFASKGFQNNFGASVTVAQPSLGAGDYHLLIQPIEGYRVARLNFGTAGAQSITVCFWSAHHRTGTYSVSITNGANNRSYVTTYTQAVADVAQYNVITIPGDTTGTWTKNNTSGIALNFSNGTGSTYTTSSTNVWLSGNYFAASAQVNGVAATSDFFRITGVTVLPGTQAPTAAQSPNIMRPFGEELQTCQRYFQWVPFWSLLPFCRCRLPNASSCSVSGTMRAIPTLSGLGPDPTTVNVNSNVNAAIWSNITAYSAVGVISAAASGAAGITGYRSYADARL